MKVLVINGPMGAGKTATGKAVAERRPGTAFIDGDWCMDLHPFVGNRETKAMAVDNILHIAGNYGKCSACSGVVLAWLMDEPWVRRSLEEGLAALGAEVKTVTLVCSREELIRRWENDHDCEWRTDRWLEASLKSLAYFAAAEDAFNTGGMTAGEAADRILAAWEGRE